MRKIPATPGYLLLGNSFRAASGLLDPIDSQCFAVIIGE